MHTKHKAIKPRPGATRREGFATSLGVIAATLGSAVGLGNIWKFPSLAGQNGGAAFILIYIICAFLVGLPVMISEFIIGRRSHANAVGSFKRLAPGQPWFLTGIAGVLASFLIMFFYTDVAGWVYSYIFKAAAGAFVAVKPGDTANIFNSFVGGLTPIYWQWIVLVVISIVIIAGVTKGIERMTKTLLPILFILLLICDIRSLTLPGASAGLAFLFKPDFSKITWAAILTAMGALLFQAVGGHGHHDHLWQLFWQIREHAVHWHPGNAGGHPGVDHGRPGHLPGGVRLRFQTGCRSLAAVYHHPHGFQGNASRPSRHRVILHPGCHRRHRSDDLPAGCRCRSPT